jgi:histone H3/H4
MADDEIKLSRALVKRIATKAGADRLSADLYAGVTDIYDKVLLEVVKGAIYVTEGRRAKTVTLGDVRQALRAMKLDVYVNQEEKYDIPLATFRRHVRIQSEEFVAAPNKARFTADAIHGLRSVVSNYLYRYIRSAAGLKAHSGAKTVDRKDLRNVHTICATFPTLVEPTGIPYVNAVPIKKKKKKKKKKTKSKLTRSGTEIMSQSPPPSPVY